MARLSSECVISGFALANAAGHERAALHAALSCGEARFSPRPLFGAAAAPERGGAVDEAFFAGAVDRRSARKLDRGTLMAVAACDAAVADAQLTLQDDELDRVGMMVGNATGGWGFVEPSMFELYGHGMPGLNAYVATAWFPAAAQGEFSIRRHLRGYTKTVAADSLSSGVAVDHALRLIANGRADAVLAGGTEAPLNALVVNAYRSAGLLSRRGAYQPFDQRSDGRVLGEGACFLVLEPRARATERGAKCYARLTSIGRGHTLSVALRDCLQRADLPARAVDLVMLDAHGSLEADRAEYAALEEVFGAREDLRLCAPKTAFGDLVGARTATDLAIGVLSLLNQTVYPSARGGEAPLPCRSGRHVAGRAEPAELAHVLVNARDEAGRALCFLLSQAA